MDNKDIKTYYTIVQDQIEYLFRVLQNYKVVIDILKNFRSEKLIAILITHILKAIPASIGLTCLNILQSSN
jgi:hypothetical protein